METRVQFPEGKPYNRSAALGTSGVDMFVYIHVGWNVVCAREGETVVQTNIKDTGRAGASAVRTYRNRRMVKQCNKGSNRSKNGTRTRVKQLSAKKDLSLR